MPIVISGDALTHLLATLAALAEADREVYKISVDPRITVDGSPAVAIKVNEGMWSSTLSTDA